MNKNSIPFRATSNKTAFYTIIFNDRKNEFYATRSANGKSYRSLQAAQKNADQLAYTRAFDAAKNKANVWINSYQNVEPIIQHLVSPSTKVVKSLKRF